MSRYRGSTLLSDSQNASERPAEVGSELPVTPKNRGGGFRSLVPDAATIVARIIPEDRRKLIVESALQKLRPGVTLGKAAADRTSEILHDLSKDPELQRNAINLIKMGIIEAAYRIGGRIGGKAAEKIADSVAQAALRRLGVEEKHSIDLAGDSHGQLSDQPPSSPSRQELATHPRLLQKS